MPPHRFPANVTSGQFSLGVAGMPLNGEIVALCYFDTLILERQSHAL
jgi:hypothetical protein